jgi:hypothetical protein
MLLCHLHLVKYLYEILHLLVHFGPDLLANLGRLSRIIPLSVLIELLLGLQQFLHGPDGLLDQLIKVNVWLNLLDRYLLG